MHAQVTRAQFKIKDATVVHSPAGANSFRRPVISRCVDGGHRSEAAQRRRLSVRRRARYDENSVA